MHTAKIIKTFIIFMSVFSGAIAAPSLRQLGNKATPTDTKNTETPKARAATVSAQKKPLGIATNTNTKKTEITPVSTTKVTQTTDSGSRLSGGRLYNSVPNKGGATSSVLGSLNSQLETLQANYDKLATKDYVDSTANQIKAETSQQIVNSTKNLPTQESVNAAIADATNSATLNTKIGEAVDEKIADYNNTVNAKIALATKDLPTTKTMQNAINSATQNMATSTAVSDAIDAKINAYDNTVTAKVNAATAGFAKQTDISSALNAYDASVDNKIANATTNLASNSSIGNVIDDKINAYNNVVDQKIANISKGLSTDEVNTAITDKLNQYDIQVNTKIANAAEGFVTKNALNDALNQQEVSTNNKIANIQTGILSEQAINNAITDKINQHDISVNQRLSEVTGNFVTKNNLNDTLAQHDISVNTRLSEYALKTEMPTVPNKLSEFENDLEFANQDYVIAKVAEVQATQIDTDALQAAIESSISKDYALKTEIPTVPQKLSDLDNDLDMSGYALKTEIPTVPQKLSDLDNDLEFANQDYVIAKVAEVQAGQIDPDTLQSAIENSIAKDYALKTDIPTVPEKLSDLDNDLDMSGYATLNDITNSMTNIKFDTSGENIVYTTNNWETQETLLPIGELAGVQGKNLQLRKDGDNIQWALDESNPTWTTLYNMQDYKGTDGKDGVDGKDGKDGVDGTNGKTPAFEMNNDGDLIVQFDGESPVNLGHVKGADGKDGTNGIDGKDGKDGTDGKTPAFDLNNDGDLIVQFDGESPVNLGRVKGADGKDGVDGKDGTNGKTPVFNLNNDGDLIVQFDGESPVNLGHVKGADAQLSANQTKAFTQLEQLLNILKDSVINIDSDGNVTAKNTQSSSSGETDE